ncbi:MAG: hypothetical protein GY791_02105 [Alphaproteobacteria bacterium]|nr:hypothetical protein [Alphaproteobacteria bacterium]
MKTVYESQFYDFVLDEDADALVFRWKPEARTLTDNDFKEGLSNFAGYGFELRVTKMVVDVRDFAPAPGVPSAEAMGPWRSRVAVPRYNRAGITKFAYLRNREGGGPPVGGPVRHDGEDFETAVFDSEAELAAWLNS